MNITYSFNYQKMMENIYKDARWEAYYDMVIIPLFSKCCEEKVIKIVPVHATRKSGRKPLVEKKHFIETYSCVKNVPNKKGEIEGKRVGIPDFVIVPSESEYEKPQKALVYIEFKLPEGLTREYVEIKPQKHKVELLHQFELCKNIIFTDGVTWYFLENEEDIEKAEPIRLYDSKNKCWKDNGEEYSDTEIELLKRIEGILDRVLLEKNSVNHKTSSLHISSKGTY